MTPNAPRPSAELTVEGLAALGPGNACDAEPIHRCGAIQPHGFLLAVDPEHLTVVAASANAAQHLGTLPDGDPGVEAAEVLGADLVDLLGPQAVESVLWGVMSSNPHEGLPIRLEVHARPGSGHRPGREYDMVAHISGGLLVLELEPAGGPKSAASAVFYQRQRSAMQKLGTVDDVERICSVAVGELRALTGYDAVRIYRFEPDAHGVVIAEDCAPGVERYLGLHYPAGDIPRQARALYLRNWIRVIGDVGYQPVPILALSGVLRPDELDLTMSVLRSVSPVHLQYLRNMGVSASMSISLVVENQLWGLIACHHGTPRHLSHVQRLACETIGQLVSVRIRGAQTLARYEEAAVLGRSVTQVVTAMVAGETPALGATGASESLLGMVAADGAVVDIDGMRVSTGSVPAPQDVERIVARLKAVEGSNGRLVVTDGLPELLAAGQSPGRSTTGGATVEHPPPAGALFLPFSGRARGFLLWFRGERTETLRWAGRVDDKPAAPGNISAAEEIAPLTPRASFAEWCEQRRGRSEPWRAAEVTAAAQLVDAIPDVLLHRSQSRLVRFAMHDPLTGLPNRRLLSDRLDQLLATLDLQLATAAGDGGGSADGVRGHPAAGLLFVELEGLPPRTPQGTSVEEEVLALLADRMSAVVRPRDTVARMGGYEFVVLLPDADAVEACLVGERIIEELCRSFTLDGQASRTLTVNVGAASIAPGTEVAEALRRVDAALYHARRAGRNQLAVYDAASGTTASREQHAAQQLSKALAAGHLQLHYQPIIDLRRPLDRPEGFDALLRWQLPSLGLLTPDRFVAMAERTGLIHDLGRAIIAGAAQQLRSLADDDQIISVTVSVHELARPDFVAETLACLAAAEVSPRRLRIEIREPQLREEPHLALAALRELDAAGLGIAIGDFGTGFGALAALRTLPHLVVKIGEQLVAGLPDSHEDRAVVTATLQLARALGWCTVAEGVRTPEQLAVLRELGCDFAQGGFVGLPVPAQVVELPPS